MMRDSETELQVLGHFMFNEDMEIPDIPVSYFDVRSHQEIWLAIKGLRDKGLATGVNAVYQEIAKLPRTQVTLDLLMNIADKTLPNQNIESRLNTLKELKNKRDLITLKDSIESKLEHGLTSTQVAEQIIDQAKEIAKESHGGKSLTQEIRDLISVTKGHISVTEVEQSVTNRHTKKGSVRKLLARLAKDEGIIEPTGKAGLYRVADRDLTEIEWMKVQNTEIDFRWPLNINQFFRLMPKNIVIVAGEPDSGKTAFLLNVAALNMGKHKIKYFSSEMGALELRSRLEQFALVEEDPTPLKLEDWNNDNFKVYERVANFSDVIDPNGINIIDFLEIYNEFYRVSEYIKEMFDKLETGIAVIAIQKNSGALWGLGGQRTIEKARLAVNLNNDGYVHTAQLIKVKNWRNPQDNPNYMKIDYSLVRGCYFKPQSSWVKEYPSKGDSHEQSNSYGKTNQRPRTQTHTERNGSAKRFNSDF